LIPNYRLLVSGVINDKTYIILAKRNKGYAEPEFRLWVLLPLAFVQAGGLLLYGVGVGRGLPWIVPAIGMGLIGFCLVASVSILLSYVWDCYAHIVDEEAVTAVLIIRAIIATGFTFANQPWITASGIQNTFIACAMIAFVGFLSSAIFLKWGKSFERYSAQRYLSDMTHGM
jgi:hypothetical protein